MLKPKRCQFKLQSFKLKRTSLDVETKMSSIKQFILYKEKNESPLSSTDGTSTLNNKMSTASSITISVYVQSFCALLVCSLIKSNHSNEFRLQLVLPNITIYLLALKQLFLHILTQKNNTLGYFSEAQFCDLLSTKY